MTAIAMPRTTVAFYDKDELPDEYKKVIEFGKEYGYYPDKEHPLVMFFDEDLKEYASDIVAKWLTPEHTITNLVLPIIDCEDKRAVVILDHHEGYLIIDLRV